jgi:MSHA biogenesis protein MshL
MQPTRLINCCIAAVAILSQGGCSFPRSLLKPADVKERFDKPALVNESTDESLDLETDYIPESVFMVRQVAPQGQLPAVRVGGLSVTEAGLYDVMQLLFADTGYSLTFEGGADASRRYGSVTSSNLNGNLTDVVNQLADSLGFFWSIRAGKAIVIQPEQQFMVDLPPVLGDDNLAGITNTVQYLGARDVYLDRINRSLVFRSNRRALASVESYLKRLRESRSMLVYEMQVLQVDLNDNSQMGIQWKTFSGAGGPQVSKSQDATGIVNGGNTSGNLIANKAISAATGAGVESLNTFIYGPRFSMNLLLTFLKSQGEVKTISQPRIGLMSGTKGLLRVGQSTTYVSKVGSINSSGLNQVTVDTKDLKTGLEISLSGEEHDKTIYTRINLSITELLQFTKYIALGTDLTLPEVADRELRTQVRSRPGDTILLGGITVTRAEQTRIMGASANSKGQQVKQSELVIAIRPRIVNFTSAGKKLDALPAEVMGVAPQQPTNVDAVPVLAVPVQTPIKVIQPTPIVAPVVEKSELKPVQEKVATVSPAKPVVAQVKDVSETTAAVKSLVKKTAEKAVTEPSVSAVSSPAMVAPTSLPEVENMPDELPGSQSSTKWSFTDIGFINKAVQAVKSVSHLVWFGDKERTQ